MRITTRNIALMAVFAALYYVLSLITPFIPAIGVPEIKISLEAMIATVFGIVLGPYLGFASAFVGAGVAFALPPTSMAPTALPFILSPPINALVSGLIYYKKWKLGFAAFAVLIIAFLFTPPVQPLAENSTIALAVLFDKIIALLLILPLVKFAKHMTKGTAVAAFFFILAFIGNQADNMWGSFIFATPVVYNGVFGMDVATVRYLFLLSPFAYPAIRLVEAFIVMLIAVPLVKTLTGTPWLWKKENILTPAEKENEPPPVTA